MAPPTTKLIGSHVDSPRSWLILACSCSCSFCFSLLPTSLGMIQVEMIDDLKFGSGMISIMSSCAIGFNTLLGPLSGVIASVLTMRVTVMLGVILMSLSMLCTSFSHSLPSLMLFYGILTGLGHGIAYSQCFIIVHSYFHKKRLLANGILMSASAVGILTLPYLHRFVIDQYGWRFSFALNAALILHILVFASFFKPTEMERMGMVSLQTCCSREGDASKNGSECDEDGDNNNDDEDGDNNDEILTKANNGSNSCDPQEEKLFLSKESIQGSQYSKRIDMLIKSTDNNVGQGVETLNGSSVGGGRPYIPVFINGTPKLRSRVSDFIATHSPSMRRSLLSDDSGDVMSRTRKDSDVSRLSSAVSAFSLDEHQPSSPTSPTTPTTPTFTTTTTVCMTPPATATLSTPRPFGQLRKKGSRSYLGSSLVFVSTDFGSSIMLPLAIEEIKKAEEDGDDYEDGMMGEEESLKTKLKRIASCKSMWLFCCNSMCFMCGCSTLAVHLPSYVVSRGIAFDRVADIYLVYGIVVTLSRLGGGALFHRLKPPLLVLVFFLQAFNGIVLLTAPLYATNLYGIYAMEIGVGVLYGQAYMMQAPVMTQLVGIHDLSLSFGFMQLFNGLGYICFGTFAGFLYDSTGTYDIPFHIAGSIVLGGSFFLPLIFFLTRNDRKNDDDDDDDDDDGCDDLGEEGKMDKARI